MAKKRGYVNSKGEIVIPQSRRQTKATLKKNRAESEMRRRKEGTTPLPKRHWSHWL